MRPELLADSKDVWKWRIAIRKAKDSGQVVYWVAMYRPDENRRGDDERAVPNAIPEVEAFFAKERAFVASGYPACLSRTAIVCHQLGVEMFANLHDYPSSETRRKAYIEEVCAAISRRAEESKPLLVLLDPDDGIGQRRSNGKQFHKEHLCIVWNELKTGDTMGLVQFKQHLHNGDVPNSWHLAVQKDIAGILGVPVEEVVHHRWDIVCILHAVGNDTFPAPAFRQPRRAVRLRGARAPGPSDTHRSTRNRPCSRDSKVLRRGARTLPPSETFDGSGNLRSRTCSTLSRSASLPPSPSS